MMYRDAIRRSPFAVERSLARIEGMLMSVFGGEGKKLPDYRDLVGHTYTERERKELDRMYDDDRKRGKAAFAAGLMAQKTAGAA